MTDPKEDEASSEETTVPVVGDPDADEEFAPFDELQDAFKPGQIQKVRVADGLPTQVAPQSGKSDIPPLSVETLVCMGDFSEFVSRNTERERFLPEDVERGEDGIWRVTRSDRKGILVEPIRPPCQHYVRQMTQLPENPENRLILRLCSARRTTEGAFMSVSNMAMWACSMRSPRDLNSEQLLDDFDTKKVEEGRTRVYDSIFSSAE